MWTKISEPNLNVMLAELLSESGIKALGEVIIRRKKPDIVIDINGIRIIIEGKYPGKREELLREAEKRINEDLCEIVMMVEYKHLPIANLDVNQKEIKKALRNGKFNVAFKTYLDSKGLEKWIKELRGEPKFYEDVDFQDLVALLMEAYELLISERIINTVIEDLDKKITNFSMRAKGTVPVNWLKSVLELGESEQNEEE